MSRFPRVAVAATAAVLLASTSCSSEFADGLLEEGGLPAVVEPADSLTPFTEVPGRATGALLYQPFGDRDTVLVTDQGRQVALPEAIGGSSLGYTLSADGRWVTVTDPHRQRVYRLGEDEPLALTTDRGELQIPWLWSVDSRVLLTRVMEPDTQPYGLGADYTLVVPETGRQHTVSAPDGFEYAEILPWGGLLAVPEQPADDLDEVALLVVEPVSGDLVDEHTIHVRPWLSGRERVVDGDREIHVFAGEEERLLRLVVYKGDVPWAFLEVTADGTVTGRTELVLPAEWEPGRIPWALLGRAGDDLVIARTRPLDDLPGSRHELYRVAPDGSVREWVELVPAQSVRLAGAGVRDWSPVAVRSLLHVDSE